MEDLLWILFDSHLNVFDCLSVVHICICLCLESESKQAPGSTCSSRCHCHCFLLVSCWGKKDPANIWRQKRSQHATPSGAVKLWVNASTPAIGLFLSYTLDKVVCPYLANLFWNVHLPSTDGRRGEGASGRYSGRVRNLLVLSVPPVTKPIVLCRSCYPVRPMQKKTPKIARK